ncbi:Hsp70 family protein [Nocardia vinacea]|uniref:Hsp70 family protein n=1 Tax=Nocardia vinacea TaxID=96468 RepID=UPI002E0E4DBD|nr:Hsp70 family protein [Nocardia vinacea]
MNAINFGIDLGTTNSAIAVLRGVDTEIVKNNEDGDITPSAVWISRHGSLQVGRAAKDKAEIDPDNTAMEFKRHMGFAGTVKRFAGSDRGLSAEELSAEVLKSLRADVTQRLGDNVDAAVITVPAAFDLNACHATRHAAELAGLRQIPLLQEPAAAAMAHGFQSSADGVRWLVYDLGGGTFDAAVVRLRDGEFSIVTHAGNNHLGGKDIDWRIIEKLLLPALAKRHGLDVRRGDARWRATLNTLKLEAERAKIRLSRQVGTEIVADLVGPDGLRRYEFEFELRRADLERLTAPVLARTVELCRRALAEKNLGRGDIERVVLVGGPTLSPFVRDYLADPDSGLGISLDHTQDPLTVVARGAAIFAGTQRYETVSAPVVHGGFTLTLDYHPVGPDPDPLIRGSIEPADRGLSIEFGNPESRPPWHSGRLPVAADGTFATRVLAERGRLNTFQVWLSDAFGNRRQVGPDTFTYTVGAVQTEQPLIHSIGIGLADNTLLSLAPKGATLPVRCRTKLHTTTTIGPGVASGVIRIPILEGEQPRADRNRQVGCLEVRAQQVSRPLPLGSDIEFIVEIDSSRLVTARAYVPMLDEEFDQVADLESETVPTHNELADRVSEIRERLASLRSRQGQAGDPVAGMVLMRVDAAGRTETVEQRLAAARDDTDAAQGCDAMVRELHAALDEAEDALQWPELVAEARSACVEATDIVAAHGNTDDAAAMRVATLAIEEAIDTRDSRSLRQHTNDLGRLIGQVLDRAGVLQVELFHHLAARRAEMSSPPHADRLIAQGRAALDRDETAPLRSINSQLFALLPTASQAAGDPFSTVRPSY